MKRYIRSNKYEYKSHPTENDIINVVSTAIAYFSSYDRWNSRADWSGQVFVHPDYFDDDSNSYIYGIWIGSNLGGYSAYIYNNDIIDRPEILKKYNFAPIGSWYITGTGDEIRSITEEYPANV